MEGLRELTIAVDRISIPLRVVVFFLMTVGFILKVKRAEFTAEAVLPVIATSVIILGFIASQDWWFKQTQDVFFTIAHQIKADYETNPYKSIESLKEAKQTKEQNEGFGHLIKNIKASLLEAFLNGFMYILIAFASGLQVIFVCIYSILIEVFRLLFPMALACYQFDSLRGLGFNFVSKALSVMAWPVGFALIERIAQALQAHFYHSHSAFDSLHGGIFFPVLVSILVIGGTLATPQLMGALFTSGDVSGSATGFARSAISAMQGLGGRANRALGNALSHSSGAKGLVNTPALDSFNAQPSNRPSGKSLPLAFALQGSSFPAFVSSSDYEKVSLANSPPLDLLPSGRPIPLLPPPTQSTPSAQNKPLSSRTVSQSSQGFERQIGPSTKKAANLDTPKALQKRRIAQEHSKIAASFNVDKNDENNNPSAPLYNGFNTPTKKPTGAAILNFSNTFYTTKANQIAESIDKKNTLLF